MSALELQQCQPQEDLSYDLLLQKCSATATSADASTEDPSSPRGSSGAAETEVASSAGDAAAQKPRAKPAKGSLQLLSNVHVHSKEEGVRSLLAKTRLLSETTFGEDCLRDITKKSKWQLSLLVSADQASLYGFIVTKTANGCLSIAKIAVAPECRGMGLGKHFMEEVTKAAKKRGDVYDVCLSSLATAVTFYQRLGFKAFKDMKVAVDFEVEEGQVYMEKKLRQRPRRK